MRTPIYDFARSYAEGRALRAHMPGHKGRARLGAEPLDITELSGADSLYEARGIIKESEDNASMLFGSHTFYSTEGSSLAIRAMVAMVKRYALENGKKPLILATRNAHKSFVYATALLDIDVEWIYGENYLSCKPSEAELCECIERLRPATLYVTSPDYLGGVMDTKRISELCHKAGVLLMVDNAHGAYLKFLDSSLHPIDLGADICCDSAHKTLPALTGGAYMHISGNAPAGLVSYAKESMELFASTSPSYLILESLDIANRELSSGYAQRIARLARDIQKYKAKLNTGGYVLLEEEPLKITVAAKEYGYYGYEIAEILRSEEILVEFSDRDYTVFMLTPDNDERELDKLVSALLGIPRRVRIEEAQPRQARLERRIPAKEALFLPSECLPVSNSVGRVFASAQLSCPPAVPVVISGEVITEEAKEALVYYGIETVKVLK